VGQIKAEVKSKIGPLSILDAEYDMGPFLEEATDQNVNSLMRYAIFTNDTKLLDFLISLRQ
jgi:hypothetical protein